MVDVNIMDSAACLYTYIYEIYYEIGRSAYMYICVARHISVWQKLARLR